MSQNLQNFVKFRKFQLDNLVDFEKCCKTRIFLQKSEPIQPKTSNIFPKFCRSAVWTSQRGAGLGGFYVPAQEAIAGQFEPEMSERSVRERSENLETMSLQKF